MSNELGLEPLRYVKNGNKVPKTEGARACMALPVGKPADLDYTWYYREACKIAQACGCFDYLTPVEQHLIKTVKKEKRISNGK